MTTQMTQAQMIEAARKVVLTIKKMEVLVTVLVYQVTSMHSLFLLAARLNTVTGKVVLHGRLMVNVQPKNK